jgi:UDP-N-acetylmuramoylalanine--D-glutamate ligase
MTPREIILIGLGREARAACAYFRAAAPLASIRVFDDDPQKAESFAGTHNAQVIDGAAILTNKNIDTIFLRAPGAPPTHTLLAALAAANQTLTTYLGYWLSQHKASVMATVTGSKGKSTTTSLTGLILQKAGLNLRVGGNIGIVPEGPPGGEKWVFETSSYQLHDIPAAAPVHALTSLYPEHLDWHGGFDNYLAAKLRPLVLDANCVGVIPRGLRDRVAHLPNRFFFADDHAHIKPDAISLFHEGESVRVAFSEAGAERLANNPLLNHNLGVAATVALVASGLPLETIAHAASAAIDAWAGLPSRQALVGKFADRIWIDDALATIPQATLAALQQWPNRPVKLIMGGRDRHQDFSTMIDYVNTRPDVTIFAYGDSAKHIAAGVPGMVLCQNFDEALAGAYGASAPGDVILFSPAGATQEKGASYEDRARRFAEFARSKGNADG